MIPSKLELKGTMHGVAIVDGRGDIKAVIDPGVQTVAMMRREDIELGELFCQAPQMAERITQLTTDYAEIQHESEAIKSSVFRLREALKIASGSIREICNCRAIPYPVSTLKRCDAVLKETPEQSTAHIKAGAIRDLKNRLETSQCATAVWLDFEADRIEREAGL